MYRLLTLTLAAVLLCTAPLTAADDAADDEAAKLVRQLGDKSFRVREQATRELAALGVAAKKALQAGLKSPNAEVRSRSRKILDTVLEADYQKRLAAFADDPQGKLDVMLPLWPQYRKTVGEDAAARALFAGMHQAEAKLLRTVEDDPKAAAKTLGERAAELYDRARESRLLSFHRVAALVYLSTQPKVEIDDTTLQRLQWVALRPGFRFGILSSTRAPALQKLVGHWIDHHAERDNDTNAYYDLLISQRYGIKQGLKPALKLLKTDGAAPVYLANAALTVGRFGERSHIEALESLLKNESPCVAEGNIAAKAVQVRDVALAMMIHLGGEKLEAYGYPGAKASENTVFAMESLWFADEAARKAALEKWVKRKGTGD